MLRRCRAHGKATLESLAGRRYGGAPRKGSVLSSWSGRVGERGARASEPHMCATRHPCTALYDSSTLAQMRCPGWRHTSRERSEWTPVRALVFVVLLVSRRTQDAERADELLVDEHHPARVVKLAACEGRAGRGARHRVRSDTARYCACGVRSARLLGGGGRGRGRGRGRGSPRRR